MKARRLLLLIIVVLITAMVVYFFPRPKDIAPVEKEVVEVKWPYLVDTSLVITPDILIEKPGYSVAENSGMIFWNDLFWTINDSGGMPWIYGMNPNSGKIEKIIKLKGSSNMDWEEISQDSTHIYIGDFGNNFGVRKDLRVFKFSKKAFPTAKDTLVQAEKISFSYENQNEFVYANKNNSFDCEAMLVLNKQIYLFSKDWINMVTTVYKIPAIAGKHIASVVDTFNTDGLITGASLLHEPNMLSLIGYKDWTPFVWVFSDFEEDNFFSGKKARLDLPAIHGAQTEGICFYDSDHLIISEEKTNASYRIYKYNLNSIKFVPPVSK